MGRRGLRVLVLACCLPLVLPPGWCCFLLLKIEPRAATFTAAARTPKAAGSCCCHTHDPQPQDDEKKQQEPRTPPFKHCPCSDRQTTPPSVTSVEHDDCGFVYLPIFASIDSSPPIVGGAEKVVPVARPHAPPLHVLNCVWRC